MKLLSNQNGAAMLVALAILLMMGLIGTAAVETSVVDLQITDNVRQDMRSFYIAEAGLEHGFAVLRDSLGWRDGLKSDLAGGSYEIAIVDKATEPALGDTILVSSVGTRSGAMTMLEMKLSPSKPFRWSAFADTTMELGGNTITDSYDSDSGSYAATKRDEEGDVGSNHKVKIYGMAEINGNASTADPGNMEIMGTSVVTGDTTTTAGVQIFDPVSDQEMADAKAGSAAPGGISGNYNYNAGSKSFSISPGKTAKLESGTYYFSSIDLKGSLELMPGAEVKIYVTGDISCNSDAKINSGGKPIDMQIFSNGEKITVNGGAEIRALVYAPETEFKLTGGADLYGAFNTKTASDNGGSSFHYDRSLRDLEFKSKLKKVCWREL